MDESHEQIIAATRTWLERAVVGLGLCPFAVKAHLRNQIRYVVTEQTSVDGVLDDLEREAKALQAADPEVCETTLLIHPRAFSDFHDYNDFLPLADATIEALGLEGELQVASFHPLYQFAGSGEDDIENFTNRSPYPMLHLLREFSVSRAVDTFPGVHDIGTKNMETLRRLGHEGWKRLWVTG